LQRDKDKLFIYDKEEDKCQPKGTSLIQMKECSLVFVCVPTPMNEDGSCHIDMVISSVEDLVSVGVSTNNIVVRSTVPVGTCKSLNVSFMPEFLTEKNWKQDVENCKDWVAAANEKNEELKPKLEELISEMGGEGMRIHFCSTDEAEACKYVRNGFLATKVSFFNEVEEFCTKKNMNYEVVRKLTTMDERIGESHSLVPGPDGKKGFGGTCLPKDASSLWFQMFQSDVSSYVLGASVLRNKNVDRVEQDWGDDKGRAVV